MPPRALSRCSAALLVLLWQLTCDQYDAAATTASAVKSVAAIPGADPTGHNDSSAALNAFVRQQCGAAAAAAPAGVGLALGALSSAPVDVSVDLGGGLYRMDAPLVINSSVPCTGMLRIHDGTLFAGPGLQRFAASNESFLVTVLDYWNGLGVSLDRLVFASNFTGGGVRVDAAHHVHVVDSNFVNFETHAVWGSALLGMGHELAVDRCRMTECTLGMAECADVRGKHATAILMEFPDSHFRNSVITCSRVGVVNRGGANQYADLHIWTSCNPTASGDNLTVGFLDESGTTQITNMYMDNCRMVLQGGGRGTTVTNSFFNGRATLELTPPPPAAAAAAATGSTAAAATGSTAASASASASAPDPSDPHCQYWRGAMCAHIITGNRFDCDGDMCSTVNVSTWTPLQAAGVIVRDNVFEGPNSSVCSLKSSCVGSDDCSTLFGPCV